MAFSTERPTLPPLHTLGLPNPATTLHELSYDNSSCPRLHIPLCHRRQTSVCSSNTSRSSSPTLFDSSSSRSSSPSTDVEVSPPTPVLSISPLSRLPNQTPSPMPPVRFRLEPCSLEDAQAIVLIPPPCAPAVPSTLTTAPAPKKQQALLLVGHSMEYFRHPQRQLAKGARIHPYRIAPSQRADCHWRRRS
ncbi:hypothetical protein H0H81_006663 [Sphagnurus paluster]|uniref:Uncharacterized protein n=1 Tax=Sphagnurus paluster TaxID=117069 RepID=A0A9P7K3K2_9AGAR|nr:hypothetical protein H0H81_006663 [Sphagnurus paluster]